MLFSSFSVLSVFRLIVLDEVDQMADRSTAEGVSKSAAGSMKNDILTTMLTVAMHEESKLIIIGNP
jgi:Cdc6-like AAA superfamily ATPase